MAVLPCNPLKVRFQLLVGDQKTDSPVLKSSLELSAVNEDRQGVKMYEPPGSPVAATFRLKKATTSARPFCGQQNEATGTKPPRLVGIEPLPWVSQVPARDGSRSHPR